MRPLTLILVALVLAFRTLAQGVNPVYTDDSPAVDGGEIRRLVPEA